MKHNKKGGTHTHTGGGGGGGGGGYKINTTVRRAGRQGMLVLLDLPSWNTDGGHYCRSNGCSDFLHIISMHLIHPQFVALVLFFVFP